MEGEVKRIKQSMAQRKQKKNNGRNTATYTSNDNKMNALHSPINRQMF